MAGMKKHVLDEALPLLDDARKAAGEFIRSAASRPVNAVATVDLLRHTLGIPLTEDGEPADVVLARLAADADPGLMASIGPRYFGFVIGGSFPVALAADWLTSTWDQNGGLYVAAPAASVIEETAHRWLLDVLDLPRDASAGFVTGGQMANTTCLAAARHQVLRQAGWNVEDDGLIGAPKVNIILSAEAHATIFSALRLLGLGSKQFISVDVDDQGRMMVDGVRSALAQCDGPTIVCVQAGNVNTGSFDAVGEIADLAHAKGAWVHVDAAFGLWARATERYRHLAAGAERADSWATDAHKWLNVPYDCGIAIVANSAAHRAAMTVAAAYLEQSAGAERDPLDWVPEFSRRARSIPVYAVLRHLGRNGVKALVERCCSHAKLFAELLAAEDGVEVLNDVVLNQTLVRFTAPGRDSDDLTRAVVRRVQADGICWLSGTTWRDVAAMRISVSNWSTSEEDVRISAEAILSAFRTILSS
jgi:glutamate/tyrosine decarboxylase-like PLP-dependent enzyme